MKWMWLGGVLSLAVAGCSEAPVGGALTIRGADAGLVIPTACADRGTERGAGVELWDDAGWSLHFAHDARTGPSLRITSPRGEPVAALSPRECATFRGELRRRTEHEEGLRHVTYGHLDVECSHGGVQVAGELDFDQCLER